MSSLDAIWLVWLCFVFGTLALLGLVVWLLCRIDRNTRPIALEPIPGELHTLPLVTLQDIVNEQVATALDEHDRYVVGQVRSRARESQ